jgi:subtilisin family serine protease
VPTLSTRIVSMLAAVALVAGLLVTAAPARADDTSRRYVVTTTSDRVTVAAAAEVEDSGGDVIHRYREVLSGFSAELTSSEVADLRDDPRVEAVVPDVRVRASGNQTSPPWGLDRIDQRSRPLDAIYGYDQAGSGVTAFVIDTGIRATHTQLTRRVTSGYDFVDADTNAADCAGHGTHVAGTIGGTTYGVAKGVREVALRVLDCHGSGWNSDVVAALDWAVQHRPQGPSVINMSLGGPVSTALDEAVARTVAAGIPVVVAAGNSDEDACDASPARAPEAITVAASDAADRRAWFSNYGSCVDLFAPGVGIVSSFVDSDTATEVLDGTSMAAPHVAGLAARLLQVDPALTPSEVADRLLATATPGVITDPQGSQNLLAFGEPSTHRVPGLPTRVTTKRSDKTASATLSWSPPSDPGTSAITAYRITRDGTDNRLRGPVTITVPAARRSVTLTGLRGNRTYHLTVRAVSGVGTGPVSRTNLTMGTVPLSAPTKVKVSKKSYRKRTAKITWSVPTDTGGRKITAYRVYRSGKNTSGKGPYAKTISPKSRSFTFTKLKRNTTYTLQVRAKTGKTYGPKATVTVRLTK